MPYVAFGIVLAALGVVNALYLWYGHRTKALICPLDHDCSVVTESKWSTLLGVRNEVLGAGYFFIVLCLYLAFALRPDFAERFGMILAILTAGGLLYSAVLVGIQRFAIKDYCFYCLISALLAFLLFMTSAFVAL